jgi:hypothetical protein
VQNTQPEATWRGACDQEPANRGVAPYIIPKVGFVTILKDFNGFLTSFGRFSPFLEDLGPFLRPDIGEKLGVCCQLQVYINQRFLKLWGGSDQKNYDELLRQSHFYAGKPLRRATLWAIFGSFVHPFSVSSVLMGS